MRRTIFIVALFLIMGLPVVEGDEDDGILFTWNGNASTVELIGEWDWNSTSSLADNGDFWTVSINLDPGLYCYKFIVDGDYIFDPGNTYRGYCDGIENSVIRVGENQPLSHHIDEDKLVVYSSENPNAEYNFVQNGNLWELEINTLSEGKHTIPLNADGKDSLAVFWTGPQSDFVWEDALIYMVMTDRFVNGNTSNDGSPTGAEAEADWQGGDLEGVTQMIESGYFTDLGVNALWISPFNTNPNGSFIAGDGQHQVSGYHGYWPIEPRQVDPRFGGEEALEEMVDAAHSMGIRVMADFVVNHVHEDHVYAQEHPDWFNQGCICGTSECDWTERRLDCLFMDYMPDLDWKNRNASEQVISDALWWIEEFDLDGLRVDAVKHVDDHAITNLATRINEKFEATGTDFYLKGETAMGWSGHSLEDNAEQYETINRYIGDDSLDGQADFVLYHAVVDNVFTTGNMDYQHLDYWTNRSQDQYVEDSVMVPYLGSHDSPRYISRIENDSTQWNQWEEQSLPTTPSLSSYQSAKQGLAWLLTTPGAPMIYMADEFGQHGGADPDNRRMLDFNFTDEQQDLYNFTRDIANLRLEHEVLRRGTYSTFHAEADLLAYEMTSDDESLLIILNRGDVDQLESPYDEVIFGDATLFDNALALSANSVTIVAKSAVEDNNTDHTNNTDNQTSNQTTNETNNNSNNTENNSSSEDNNNSQEEETKTEVEKTSDDNNSLNWIRNLLAIIVVITFLVFIQMNRKSEGNH
ncbi:MAG: alpha-amylase family glycosyl hydrolase [Candidatus Poseidoniaceae archaeon]|nr:alpha-amylase family glycosyl hydrolase [Candidatus Poseidoniaceae archaeon]